MKKILVSIILMLAMAVGSVAQTEILTICNDTSATNKYVPMYCGFFDDFTRSQFVIPADSLTDMANGMISQIKFYTTSQYIPYTTVSTVDVYLMVVDYTSISAFEPKYDNQIVYSGIIDFVATANGGETTITFTDPFYYTGGNLLIGCENITDLGYKFIYFYGQNVDGASVADSNSDGLDAVSPTQRNFIPKTTFTYTTLEPQTCLWPASLAVSNVNATSATLTWDAGDAGSWVVQYGTDNTFAQNTEITVTNPTVELTGLTTETIYYARVKAVCGVGDESLWCSVVSFEPTAKIRIGSGTASDCYLPTYILYNNSLTQQIYTTEEIGATTGAIMSVDFYAINAATRTFDIYMVATDKETFSSSTDWIAATASDLVYSGTVNFDAEAWTTIVLDNPFLYDGTQNVAIIVDDNTGTWSASINFRVFGAPSQGIRVYSDGTNYDPANPNSYSGTVMNVKNQIRLLIGDVSCLIPRGLTVENVGVNTATVTWDFDGSVSGWQLCLNGDEENLIDVTEPTYTLSGLSEATNYTVKVRAICSDGVSSWTPAFHFTTVLCEPSSQCEITFILTDSYGDGWNGAAIRVTDVGTGNVLGVITNENLNGTSGTGENEVNTHTLAVCNGREIQFSWISGSYNSECSYVVQDIYGNEIFSGNGAMSETVSHVVNCPYCGMPSDLQVSNIGINSADLTWTAGDSETAWQICINGDESNLIDVTTTSYTLSSLEPEIDYTVKVRSNCGVVRSEWIVADFTTLSTCPAPTGLVATATTDTANISWDGTSDSYIVRYREAQVQVVFSEDFENGIPDGWTNIDADGDGYQWSNMGLGVLGHQSDSCVSSISFDYTAGALFPDNWLVTPAIVLPSNREINFRFYACGQDNGYANEHYGVYISTTTATDPDAFTELWVETMDVSGGSHRVQGLWGEKNTDLTEYAGQTVYLAIRHFDVTNQFYFNVDDFMVTATVATVAEWIEEPVLSSPVELVGLNPGTIYEYQIDAICGDDNDNWTAINTFSTMPLVLSYYTIAATAGEHGTITPSGDISVVEGEDQAFVITPDADYGIDVLTVDGEVVTLTEDQLLGYTYTFSAIDADHTIDVTFASLNAADMIEAGTLSIFPNPNNGMFSIVFNNIEGKATYELIDVSGAIVVSKNIDVTSGATMNFNHSLSAGTYYLRVIIDDNVYVGQIVVE